MLDRVIATCGMMIASYEKYKPSTTPPPTQVETLAAIEEEEITVQPVATALPPLQAEAQAELIKDKEEDVDVVEVAPPTPPTLSVPPAVSTSVSKSISITIPSNYSQDPNTWN
ncbi:unnamed protein product [Linum trigynum]|uniref:Uncharacterized protein n=1 Tax=Linum trigynum TaxID=586398 RepID=A0AAV2FS36_9ROSI